MTEPQEPRDQKCCLAEGPERGMGVGKDLEGQAEGRCSAVILHLNQVGLQCDRVGQGLHTPGQALYPKTNYECVPIPRELCGGYMCRYVELQVCQRGAEDTTVWEGQLQFRGGGRLVLPW